MIPLAWTFAAPVVLLWAVWQILGWNRLAIVLAVLWLVGVIVH